MFHSRNQWLRDIFGAAEGEGARFIRSELSYLWDHAPGQIPSALVRTGAKYLGYRLGRMEARLSTRTKRALAMQKYYWR